MTYVKGVSRTMEIQGTHCSAEVREVLEVLLHNVPLSHLANLHGERRRADPFNDVHENRADLGKMHRETGSCIRRVITVLSAVFDKRGRSATMDKFTAIIFLLTRNDIISPIVLDMIDHLPIILLAFDLSNENKGTDYAIFLS